MAENYATAVGSVLSSLTSMCRTDSQGDRERCKREIRERMLFDEVARSTDVAIQGWKTDELGRIKECYAHCQIWGKHETRECNTRCLNSLVQGLWKRVNVHEYEQIAAKYTN